MKPFFNFTALLCSCIVLAQMGVNTSNPQGTFHVDGAKDNAPTGAPTATQLANDMIITSAGNVGLGTISPVTKLHIESATQGAVRITDGSQGVGKVLTSDANGLAKWDLAPIVHQSNASKTIVPGNVANTWVNSNLTVTVPETGIYYINFNARAYLNPPYSEGAFWKSELRNSGGVALGTVFGAHASGANNADVTSSFSTVQQLNKNDVLSLWFWATSIFRCVGDDNGASSITIFRLGS